jgi:hypothetical protein
VALPVHHAIAHVRYPTLLRAAGSSDPVKLSLGSSVPHPTEAVGRLALVAPTLRCSPHRQMASCHLTAPDRLKWTHVRGSHLTHDPHMRRRRGKPGQGLQRARLHRFTQQCSEGLLDVLQALAVCEVRVRAVPTYNLVRPDGEGFRAAVR